MPLNPPADAYVMVPSGLTVAVPNAGWAAIESTRIGSPSGSESLASTPIVMLLPARVRAMSARATGGRLAWSCGTRRTWTNEPVRLPAVSATS